MSSWQIDPSTGDYLMTNGAPVESEDLAIPAYYRLKVRRGQWMYAPDDEYGSDFWTVKKHFRPNEVNSLTDIGLKALQPMVDDGRAADIEASFGSSVGRNDSQINFKITDAMGQQQQLSLPVLPVG